MLTYCEKWSSIVTINIKDAVKHDFIYICMYVVGLLYEIFMLTKLASFSNFPI